MRYQLGKHFAEDCLNELRDIAQQCRGGRDVVIVLPCSVWHCRDDRAQADFDSLMTAELDYDTHWGQGEIPYNKGVEFHDVDGLTIDGQGSTLMLYGLTAPFTFWNCSKVTLQNFTIDWARPPFSEGCIRAVEGNKIIFCPSEGMPLIGGEPIWALMEYEPQAHRMGRPWRFRVKDRLHSEPDGCFSFTTDTCDGVLTVGNEVILRHVGNYRPALHFYRCTDVVLEQLTLHTAPGMGMVAHCCRNVALHGVQVRPAEGRRMSTTTDATHFISCMGQVEVEDCYFEGMGDDAINVHGFYNSITDILDEYTVRVTILNENGTQDLLFEAPDSGDDIEFAAEDTLLPFAFGKAEEVTVSETDWNAVIRFSHPLPPSLRVGNLLTSATKVPSLRFVRCHVNAIRARAALIQTRDVVLEDCLIENCTGTGIHVDTATGWYESIGTRNVTIRNNTIRGCGYGDATYCETAGIAVTTECPQNAVGVHRDLKIIGNDITCGGGNGIFLSCAQQVVVTGNVIRDCRNAVLAECCDDVVIQDNDTSGAVCVKHRSFGFPELGV